MKPLILSFLLLLSSVSLSAQWKNTKLSEEEKRAEYREKIGIDMNVPDFDTKKIDAKVMGTRLANILTFLMNNYQQGFYISQLKDIASDQNKALQYVYLEIKKMSFLYAVKKGDELAIMMKLHLHKNSSGIKQTNLLFYFIDGVSEDRKTNVLFSTISNYAQ